MEVHVVYGANDKFSKYTYTSILSLLIHSNKSYDIVCYLLTSKNNPWIVRIKKLENYFSNFKFKPVICEDNIIKSLKTSSDFIHLNYATYYRFFIDDLSGVDRIIYLDSDTIVVGDIVSLYEENLKDKIIGVVTDVPNFVIEMKNMLGLKDRKYFNSGVMLIDLEKRKEFGVSKKCLDLLRVNSYPCNDQDALNIILQDRFIWLGGKYNVQSGFWKLDNNFDDIGIDRQYYEIAKRKPMIIHYTGGYDKPWLLFNNHPCRWEYDKIKWISYKFNVGGFEFKDFFILLAHSSEYVIFPKYSIRQKARNFTNAFLKKVLSCFNYK